jgi:hypothetical protein
MFNTIAIYQDGWSTTISMTQSPRVIQEAIGNPKRTTFGDSLNRKGRIARKTYATGTPVVERDEPADLGAM